MEKNSVNILLNFSFVVVHGRKKTLCGLALARSSCGVKVYLYIEASCESHTFFSRSGSRNVSRNFLTCSDRNRSMLRASMARPRNSSTSSSGFRFSCVFLKMKCLDNKRGHGFSTFFSPFFLSL